MIPPQVADKIKGILDDPNLRVEDLYFAEQAELVESVAGEGNGSQEWATPCPTGARRMSLYVRYVVEAEEKAFKERQEQKE